MRDCRRAPKGPASDLDGARYIPCAVTLGVTYRGTLIWCLPHKLLIYLVGAQGLEPWTR
jgi:hypothetical protein